MFSKLKARVLLVDNYDSFTYNLSQLVSSLAVSVEVLSHDDPRLVEKNDFSHLILSPGPKDPSDSGLCKALVEKWVASKPILGVCLGHQVIGEVFGGKVVQAPYPVHGKTSQIIHDGSPLFSGLSKELKVARYHSLVIERESLPDTFQVSASCDSIIMAISHRYYRGLHGVQFHPESFLSEGGQKLMHNFLSMESS